MFFKAIDPIVFWDQLEKHITDELAHDGEVLGSYRVKNHLSLIFVDFSCRKALIRTRACARK